MIGIHSASRALWGIGTGMQLCMWKSFRVKWCLLTRVRKRNLEKIYSMVQAGWHMKERSPFRLWVLARELRCEHIGGMYKNVPFVWGRNMCCSASARVRRLCLVMGCEISSLSCQGLMLKVWGGEKLDVCRNVYKNTWNCNVRWNEMTSWIVMDSFNRNWWLHRSSLR